MKILIVTSKYLPAIGGLENAVRHIACHLKAQGHEVSIVTNRYDKNLIAMEMLDGIQVQRLFFTDTYPKCWNLWVWLKYGVRLLLAPLTFFKLVAFLKRNRFDIVHLHYVGSPAKYLILARNFFNFNYIVSLHGADVENFIEKTGAEKRRLKETLKCADFVTANATQLLREAFESTGTSGDSKSCVVPMAFSSEVFDQAEAVKIQGPYIFSAGRLVYKKGFDVLIEAYAEILAKNKWDIDLILAGVGEEKEKLESICKDRKIQNRVTFLGAIDSQKIASYMKGCELFVMPSRLESFGIVGLEALYTCKKVAGSRVGVLMEVMKDQDEYLAEPGNAAQLAECMSKALQDSWNPISKTFLKQKYNWEKTAECYLDIYRKILGKADA